MCECYYDGEGNLCYKHLSYVIPCRVYTRVIDSDPCELSDVIGFRGVDKDGSMEITTMSIAQYDDSPIAFRPVHPLIAEVYLANNK